MPRAIWSGSISFGLVNIPVKIFSATEQKDITFHQLDERTGARIRYKRVSERSGREVPYEQIVKGYEISDGKYVTLTDEDLDAAAPEKTRAIAIEQFVDLDEVDPIHFDKTYYLAPDGDAAARAYALLRAALKESNRAAIGRFVFRTKEYLVAIRPLRRVLALQTMLFPDEIRDAGDLPDIPAERKLPEKEAALAAQLVDSLTEEWRPDRFHDTYRERLVDLIEKKAKGEKIVVEAVEERAAPPDLMKALVASLDDARARREHAKKAPKRKRSA